MTSIVDEYLDGPMENDDVFPCKGCGEILEEGKAFELAGNRWHLDCFRCNSCSTLLDSDANLLLLGDGSLICNNCTYSCSACGNKIEDLAILTGDQAFCATCFRCRNCKRKIENLRYARTSQGIFCMGCHETLMARRRKKSKASSTSKSREKEHSPMSADKMTDKSLPALPPTASASNIPPHADSDAQAPHAHHRHNGSSSRGSSRPAPSPERDPIRADSLSLPASTYRKNRNSGMFAIADAGTGDASETFFIPVALDPSPGSHGTPRSTTESTGPRDYFSVSKSGASSDKQRSDSHASTPHIAFQDKGRQLSIDPEASQAKSPHLRKVSKAFEQDPSKASPDASKLHHDTPNAKRDLVSRSNSSHSFSVPPDATPVRASNGALRKDQPPNLSDLRRATANTPLPRASQDSRWQEDDDTAASHDAGSKPPMRSDTTKSIPRKELPSSAATRSIKEATSSTSLQAPASEKKDSPVEGQRRPRVIPAPIDSSRGVDDISPKDTSPPQKHSPKLPRWSNGGEFSMDEDMARILGTDEDSSSIMRRVSNAVRHGRTASIDSSYGTQRVGHTRSISESTRGMASPRWPKTPLVEDPSGHPGISSPVSLSSVDDPGVLKRQLRNSELRVAELERQFNTEKDLKNLNKRLIEKRKTVSVLDTQTEVMIRQLEVLAGYVERAKETKTPVDPRELEDSAVKEFVQKLDKVKMAMAASIEQLHEERDQLVEEKNLAVAHRDRALMEFEQLSSKNAQLADMNNDLTHQIQERFRSQISVDTKAHNGLGIYPQTKGGAGSSLNLDSASVATTGATTLVPDEEPIVESGPTVVHVRKGQVKKFNWKKGSKTMAQNVAKGVNRAVVAFQQNDRERMHHPVGDNIGLPYNMTVSQVEAPVTTVPNTQGKQHPDGRQPFGFFGKKNSMPKSISANAVMAPAVAEPPSTLFGSELVERTEYERRQIPTVVSRCIEEVELRGMDQEGIYRKTGGNSQVNMIKDGFDKDDNFDISDPDMDITAVTSVLKQYFRKLPTPLLTFDVYEKVLESNAVSDDTERDCLEFLMFHLARVAKREPENLMSPKNLAVVFAPTIMRDFSIEREMTDMHAKNIAMQFVIENSHRIFDDA
ncbi:hypothetical protein RJ55_06534 [Drechmeria coniospora]|nr:hypothetical protein RJ55_06534 [Drechmeria coniospora]